MQLYLNILNNFLNWVVFKFPTEFMWKSLEQIQIWMFFEF
jgi:hypothetical protein